MCEAFDLIVPKASRLPSARIVGGQKYPEALLLENLQVHVILVSITMIFR